MHGGGRDRARINNTRDMIQAQTHSPLTETSRGLIPLESRFLRAVLACHDQRHSIGPVGSTKHHAAAAAAAAAALTRTLHCPDFRLPHVSQPAG